MRKTKCRSLSNRSAGRSTYSRERGCSRLPRSPGWRSIFPAEARERAESAACSHATMWIRPRPPNARRLRKRNSGRAIGWPAKCPWPQP